MITTHTLQDRLETIKNVAEAGIEVCCGGIMGMGETHTDRLNFILQLTRLAKTPGSIPINRLINFPGTPLAETVPIDNLVFVRIVALVRIVFPTILCSFDGGAIRNVRRNAGIVFYGGS